MSNNIFSRKRFMLLSRQYFMHNYQLLLLGMVAYMGVIFIILSIAQLGNNLQPDDVDMFRVFLLAFVGVFGVLYVGHSFPGFRTKESTINYLMMPGSVLEKFIFEFLSRIVMMLTILPVMFWITFHLEGYFISMFTDHVFEPVGFDFLTKLEVSGIDNFGWLFTMIVSGVLFGLSLAFTGAAMFTRQPLVKSLFSVAVIIICYTFFAYIVIEHLGVGNYNPPDSMWLIPNNEVAGYQFMSAALLLGSLVMLFVAFIKLKEREV